MLKGLIRTMVFFVVDVATRKVEIAGVRVDPDGAWMAQIARNLIVSVRPTGVVFPVVAAARPDPRAGGRSGLGLRTITD